MYNVQINNCNNLCDGNIVIKKNKLNIKYGINGTGKTTLSKAIRFSNSSEEIAKLKTFGASDEASVSVTPNINNVLVFDEDFVNQIVFQKNEVIGKPFEVFIKTSNYDSKKRELDLRLQSLKRLMEEDPDILNLRDKLISLKGKFAFTAKDKLSTRSAMSSILTKENLYNIPDELKCYSEFFDNTDTNIAWITWKNQGEKYDKVDNCPYCAEGLLPIHKKRTETFSKTYTKANSQNLQEIMDLFKALEEYIKPAKFAEIMMYIKNDTPEDVISAVLKKIYVDLELLVARFEAITNFGKRQIAIADISNLDVQVSSMEIPQSLLEFFGGEKVNSIVERINDSVITLQSEIGNLKKGMGALKGLIQATIIESQNDINEFLKTAGIYYELVINSEDETSSKTILQQCYSDDKTEVADIRDRLSWGEKNAFSLILFMYYAQSQNPDLIILDDPVSSFDSNKKFAILHRMLKKDIGKKDVSLSGKTVLLLTHDFEPITDFIVVGKSSEDAAISSYIWNICGTLKEKEINPRHDVKLISVEAKEIARDENVNIVTRIAFLRKYCELKNKEGNAGYAYEILSSLIHGTTIRRKVGNNLYEDIPSSEIIEGNDFILEFIPNFEFEDLAENIYSEEGIKNLYKEEENAYFKIQLFRALREISQKVKVKPLENAWFKFIDETYHIENDYLHYLDLIKFNIVPSYISIIVDEIMETI
ncbi:MAG: AAA family ATPase [Candidatus Cloacimonetes bacterium]|nr:AAA family ATPase [Candidatus Cloacimonadota bacterium]MDY0230283.1 AAA family ATPase [Candidatus Cloacimonadaceae bacterium]